MKASLDPYNISDDVFVSHIQQAARELTVSYTRQDQQGMGDGVADKPALQVIVLVSSSYFISNVHHDRPAAYLVTVSLV